MKEQFVTYDIALKLDQIRIATENDLKTKSWGY